MVRLKKRYFITLVSILGLIWLSLGCKQPVMVTQSKHEELVSKITVSPLVMPTDSASTVYTGLNHPLTVHHVYKKHGFELIWLQDSASVLADSMIYFLSNVRFNGLLPQDYHYAELSGMPWPIPNRMLRYRKEALLTDAYLTVSMDLKYGRINPRVDQQEIERSALSVLENAQSKKKFMEFLEAQEPRHPQYQLLKSALHDMLNNADSLDRRVLLSGVTYDSVADHRKIQLIEVNMERWRSEVADFGDRYIWINIPAYQLRVFEGTRSVLESRVIVGDPDTPTPTLNSTVESISVYPYWNVPRKIAVEELLPAIQQDTSYLRRNNFDVLDKSGAIRDPVTLEWRKYNKDYFPFSLRQRQGKGNSLGIIKFVFSNPYAVYLHDTNAKWLFQKDFRALSHGCIRMEKAVELAKYLVPESGTIEKVIERKKQTTIGLRRPVRIYTRYLTCEFMDDALTCYDDVYGLDLAMIKLLYNPDRTDSSDQLNIGVISR